MHRLIDYFSFLFRLILRIYSFPLLTIINGCLSFLGAEFCLRLFSLSLLSLVLSLKDGYNAFYTL